MNMDADEPSKTPISGPVVLSRLITLIKRYVVLPPFAATSIALWIIRAHAHNCFNVNPRLAFLSPEKRCGKTTALEVVSLLTPRAVMASNATPASLFRMMGSHQLTVLLDEIDTFKDSHPELRGILNSGHRRQGAFVLRCVGDKHEPKAFSTWCPIVFGAIGTLPGTILDRSIVVKMHRRAKGEVIYPLRSTGKQWQVVRREFLSLTQAIGRWVIDHELALKESEPEIPKELNDRAADNWAPLLTIAEVIGGAWPEKARNAAIKLSGAFDTDEESLGIQLLQDIRACFGDSKTKIRSRDLCASLALLEERPWQTSNNGRPISPMQLAGILRTFDIRSQDIWDNGSVKGYFRKSFDQAFKRYVGDAQTYTVPARPKRENARGHSLQIKPSAAPRALASQLTSKGHSRQSFRTAQQEMWRRAVPLREPGS